MCAAYKIVGGAYICHVLQNNSKTLIKLTYVVIFNAFVHFNLYFSRYAGAITKNKYLINLNLEIIYSLKKLIVKLVFSA